MAIAAGYRMWPVERVSSAQEFAKAKEAYPTVGAR